MIIKKIKNFSYEIEFLRAISILLVLLFHFELFSFSGGFIGVDVFFVISGYLITSIVINKDEFNIINFYLKRLRRLFPIILLVTILTIFFGLIILSPLHFERLTKSSSSAIFGLSNFFFFSEKGYFDYEKLFKPLLHTWSLSVELQFYLIWPLIIIFFKKFFYKSVLLSIFLLFIFTLILSTIYSFRSESFFYFTGFRFYEFMIGALIVFWNKKFSKKFSNILFLLGLILIISSSLIFDSNYNFPGFFALIPALGAAFIILTGSSANKFYFLIKNRFSILLGKISYTIYMTHWPILILYKYQKIDDLIFFEKITIIFIIFVISLFLHKKFEEPFRNNVSNKNYIKNLYLLILFIFTITLIFISNSYIKSENNYFNKKFINENESIKKIFIGREIKSKIEKKLLEKNVKSLYFNSPDQYQKIIVIGDSHAFDFYLALNNIENYNKYYQFDYIIFDYLYCFKVKTKKDEVIEYFNYKILKRKNSCQLVFNSFDLNILKDADSIIIANRWPENIDYESLINFFKNLNKKIILVGNGQQFYDIPTLFYKKKEKINLFLKNVNEKLEIQNDQIKNVTKKNNIKYFDKSRLNCNPKCIAYENKILLYSDKDHWAYYGLDFFSKKIYESNLSKLLK